VRELSPLLARPLLKEVADPQLLLRQAREGIESLTALLGTEDATCGAVMLNVGRSGLFEIPESLRPIHALLQSQAERKGELVLDGEGLPDHQLALLRFLNAPFSEIAAYDQYVSDKSPFDTHQGVKGREFDRVMVLIDPGETRGFMFDYEKLFGTKPQTATDKRNMEEGRETSMDRTKRLLYVTCSRAQKSLAIIAYSSAPDVVRTTMVRNGWFAEDEIVTTL
jgi:DNA helicase-2/ATP-dependent DNA helicase PcrA